MTEDQLQRLAAEHRAQRSHDATLNLIVELLADIRQRLVKLELLTGAGLEDTLARLERIETKPPG